MNRPPPAILPTAIAAAALLSLSLTANAQSIPNPSDASPCPAGMTLGVGAAGQRKCIGIPTAPVFPGQKSILDIENQYNSQINAPITATGVALTDNIRRAPTPTNPWATEVVANVGAQNWTPPLNVQIAPDGTPVGVDVIGTFQGGAALKVTEALAGKIMSTTCAVPTDANIKANLEGTYRVSLSFFQAAKAPNGMPWCEPSHWPDASGNLPGGQILQTSARRALAATTATTPMRINDAFGASQCWTASQISSVSSDGNAAISAVLAQANSTGNSFAYCTLNNGTAPHLYSMTEKRTCLPTSADSACHNTLASGPAPMKVTNFFGASQCWTAAQISLVSSAGNAAISSVLAQANSTGNSFAYCTLNNGTAPHLYSMTEKRTCLPTSDDAACHKPLSLLPNSALSTLQNTYQAGGAFSPTGLAVANNYTLFNGTQQTAIAPGSPDWRAPAGSTLNPNAELGTRLTGVLPDARLVEVTTDVGGVRLTTSCAIPSNAARTEYLSGVYQIALPIFQSMTASNGITHYCSPSYW